MARAIREDHVIPADELRELLTESEKLVTSPSSPDAVLRLFQHLDRIAALWPELDQGGLDLRPEAGRLEGLHATVRGRAGRLLRALRPDGGIAALRAKHRPPGDADWWWHLDGLVRERRLHRLRTAAITATGVLVVGAIVVVILNLLFPVDPLVSASMTRQNTGQMMVAEQDDYEGGLAEFEAAVQLTPDDPEAWLWVGVLSEKLNQPDKAGQAFARARTLLTNEAEYYIQRGATYLNAKQLEPARRDLESAIAVDPEHPLAFYYLASYYEVQGDSLNALKNLEKASTYADARKQPELTAMARYRMGMMMQIGPGQSLGTPTPTPPPGK